MYRPIIALFMGLGYHSVEKEVPIFRTLKTGKRVDLLFINDVKKAAVEVKTRDWERALFQAYLNSYFFDESYVALPRDVVEKLDFSIFEHYHVGIVSIDKKRAEIVLRPGEPPWLI